MTEPVTILRDHVNPITGLAFLQSQSILASSDDYGRITMWDLNTMKSLGNLDLPETSISSIECCGDPTAPDTLLLFIQAKIGFILVYRYRIANNAFEKIDQWSTGTYTFCKISLLTTTNGTILVSFPSASDLNAVSIISWPAKAPFLSNFKPLQTDKDSGMCLITKLFAHPESQSILLLCGYEDGKLCVIEIHNSNEYKLIMEHRVLTESVTCCDFNSETESIVVVGASKIVKVLRKILGDVECFREDKLELTNDGADTVAIRQDGKLFITGGWDAKLRLFSMKSLQPLAIIEHHYETVSVVKSCLLNGKHLIIAGSNDGTISIWDLYNM